MAIFVSFETDISNSELLRLSKITVRAERKHWIRWSEGGAAAFLNRTGSDFVDGFASAKAKARASFD